MSAKDDAVNSNKVDLTQSGGYQTEEDRTRRLLRLEIDSETFGEPGNPTFGEITLPGFLDEGGGPTPPPSNVLPPPSSTVATGGDSVFDELIDGLLWRYHVFLNPGSATFACTQSLVADIFCVGGGGGGGGADHTPNTERVGGSGGGGGVIEYPATFVPTGSYSVQVGAGGAGGFISSTNVVTFPSSGQNSFFHTIVAFGGGAGGTGNSPLIGGNGYDGGSGGGAGTHSDPNLRYGGNGTFGQGRRGGNNFNTTGAKINLAFAEAAPGGGGAGGEGEPPIKLGSGNFNAEVPGDGGVGLYFPQYYMYGESGWYGGGAGGSFRGLTNYFSGGSGGTGGGADGVALSSSSIQTFNGNNGLSTSGGGASGAGTTSSVGNPVGGTGGSGIVIVRYQLAT